MSFKRYIKNGVKYILKEHKPTIVKVEVVQKTNNEMFKNKNILITGGSRGLGFYMAKKFISDGAKVIITGRNKEKLEKAKKELGERSDYKVLDMGKIDSFSNFINCLYKEYNHIDCLINNAGISLHEGSLENVDEKKFEEQIKTNLEGAYFLAKEYILRLQNEKKCGNIIFISSERGAQCDFLPYGLTKVALNSLVEGLSRKYYKEGIRVNGVAPGVTATDMTGISKDNNLYAENASGRYFIPEEVAEVVEFLASENSKCVSGEIIYCDAGQHLNPWWK